QSITKPSQQIHQDTNIINLSPQKTLGGATPERVPFVSRLDPRFHHFADIRPSDRLKHRTSSYHWKIPGPTSPNPATTAGDCHALKQLLYARPFRTLRLSLPKLPNWCTHSIHDDQTESLSNTWSRYSSSHDLMRR